MWPGVEPTQGSYNETYLDELDKIVTMSASKGVYTLLDMHQDVLSEYFCGEGIPSWAVRYSDGGAYVPKIYHPDFPSPVDKPYTDFYADPLQDGALFPTRQACKQEDDGKWPSYYAASATAQAFQALYDNQDGMADKWGAMWAHVAQRFKDRPEVLGIELINEPYAGDFYRNPGIMIPYPSPTNADRVNLQPAYDLVASHIRVVDDDVLLFFAGVTWGDFGAGFDAPPGGDRYADRSVLAYHYYDPPQKSVGLQFAAETKAARRLGVAAFLTETAGPKGFSNGTYDGADRFETKGGVADGADKHLQSWATWEFKTFCRIGSAASGTSQNDDYGSCKTGYGNDWKEADRPGADIESEYARTYPMAVAGVTDAFSYDVHTFDFALSYDVDLSVSEPTVVFLHKAMHYPNGASVVCPKGDVVESGNFVRITPKAGVANGDRITVSIKAL